MWCSKKAKAPHTDENRNDELGFRCPQTAAEWQAWRDRETQVLLRSGYQANARHMAEVFNSCKSALDAQPKAALCMKNLQTFARPRLLQKTPGHTLGLEMTDQEYLDSIPDKEFFHLPDAFKSQDFLQALDQDSASIEKAFAVIDNYNKQLTADALRISYLLFESDALLSPDDTAAKKRLLLVIPHTDYDQFIQYALRDDVSRPLGQSVSIIVVQKVDQETKQPLAVPLVYFNDLYRVRTGNEVSYSTRGLVAAALLR